MQFNLGDYCAAAASELLFRDDWQYQIFFVQLHVFSVLKHSGAELPLLAVERCEKVCVCGLLGEIGR